MHDPSLIHASLASLAMCAVLSHQDPPCPLASHYFSRPTAVNLADSAIKLKGVTRTACDVHGSTPSSVVEAVVSAAEGFLQEDIDANRVSGMMRRNILLQTMYIHHMKM